MQIVQTVTQQMPLTDADAEPILVAHVLVGH